MTGVEELRLGMVNVEETAALETPSTRRHAPWHGCDSGEFTEGDLEKGPHHSRRGLTLDQHVIPNFVNKTKYSSHVCPGSFIPHTWI
jgi:hypothetical protein